MPLRIIAVNSIDTLNAVNSSWPRTSGVAGDVIPDTRQVFIPVYIPALCHRLKGNGRLSNGEERRCVRYEQREKSVCWSRSHRLRIPMKRKVARSDPEVATSVDTKIIRWMGLSPGRARRGRASLSMSVIEHKTARA